MRKTKYKKKKSKAKMQKKGEKNINSSNVDGKKNVTVIFKDKLKEFFSKNRKIILGGVSLCVLVGCIFVIYSRTGLFDNDNNVLEREEFNSKLLNFDPLKDEIGLKGIITNVDNTNTAIVEFADSSFVISKNDKIADFWRVEDITRNQVFLYNTNKGLDKMLQLKEMEG